MSSIKPEPLNWCEPTLPTETYRGVTYTAVLAHPSCRVGGWVSIALPKDKPPASLAHSPKTFNHDGVIRIFPEKDQETGHWKILFEMTRPTDTAALRTAARTCINYMLGPANESKKASTEKKETEPWRTLKEPGPPIAAEAVIEYKIEHKLGGATSFIILNKQTSAGNLDKTIYKHFSAIDISKFATGIYWRQTAMPVVLGDYQILKNFIAFHILSLP